MKEFSKICFVFLEKPARTFQLLGTVQPKVLTDKELYHLQLMHLNFEQDQFGVKLLEST